MQNKEGSLKRSESLDALRGISILLMVLSGSIAFGGVLPGWMYHAQEPPPDHIFRPELPGITWVDLVFPFFLFSMGAAIPLSLNKRLNKGENLLIIVLHFIERYFLLALFAIFTIHAHSPLLTGSGETRGYEYFVSIACYLLLFLIYSRWNGKWHLPVKLLSIGVALAFLFVYPFRQGFNPADSDIIILLLANMALFGSIIWLLTREDPWIRIGVLPFIMAVLLASGISGTINWSLFNWTPAEWLYKFTYLKYLFIVIPGTFAGDWMLKKSSADGGRVTRPGMAVVAVMISGVILSNIICLYSRWLFLNLAISLLSSIALVLLFKRFKVNQLWNNFLKAGIYLLLLGLFFEAYENGIKKDFPTYSYYFVSAGLAFLTLLVLNILESLHVFALAFRWLSDNGKNPMIAYTTGTLFLVPLFRITGISIWFDQLNTGAGAGFLRGAIFTGIVSLITVFFTRKKIFWRT